jgi:hypothetical protein
MQQPNTALERPVWWAVDQALVRRKVLAIAPKFEFYDTQGGLLLYCQQKLFKFKEDIRVYSDRSKQHEIMTIKARQIIDFSAAYDVVDTQQNVKVGALRRKGWKSLFRDSWEILDIEDNVIGYATETGNALLRRFINIIPQRFSIELGPEVVGRIRRSWNPFVFKADVDFTMDPERKLDRRLAMATALLLMAIEGRQQN